MGIEVTYNGVELLVPHFDEWYDETVYSPDGMDQTGVRLAFRFQTLYNPVITNTVVGQKAGVTARELRKILQRPRKKLTIVIDGEVVVESPSPLIGPGVKTDAIGGPFPVGVDAVQVIGQHSILVQFGLVTVLTDCSLLSLVGDRRRNAVLANKWDMFEYINRERYVTRITKGRIVLDRSILQLTLSQADDFRRYWAFQVPLGYKRENVTTEVSSNGREISYTLTDITQPLQIIDPDGEITHVEGRYSFGYDNTNMSFWDNLFVGLFGAVGGAVGGASAPGSSFPDALTPVGLWHSIKALFGGDKTSGARVSSGIGTGVGHVSQFFGSTQNKFTVTVYAERECTRNKLATSCLKAMLGYGFSLNVIKTLPNTAFNFTVDVVGKQATLTVLFKVSGFLKGLKGLVEGVTGGLFFPGIIGAGVGLAGVKASFPEILGLASDPLMTDDRSNHWGRKAPRLSNGTRASAQKLFSDILWDGPCGRLLPGEKRNVEVPFTDVVDNAVPTRDSIAP